MTRTGRDDRLLVNSEFNSEILSSKCEKKMSEGGREGGRGIERDIHL